MNDPTGIVAAANVAAGGKPKKSASDILTTARSRLDMAVLAESLKSLAVGAPLEPGWRIFSLEPAAMRACFA